MEVKKELQFLCESLKGKVNSRANPALTRMLIEARGHLKSTLWSDREGRYQIERINELNQGVTK